MDTPAYPEFERLARHYTQVPVMRTIAADVLTPVAAFLRLAAPEPECFLLESVEGGEKIGRYTFLGLRPYMTFTGRGDAIAIRRGRRTERRRQPILAALKQIFAEHTPAPVEGLPPFTAGAVGYFAYDYVRMLERLPATAKNDLQLPDCTLMFFDRLLAFDHVRHELHIIATADVRQEAPQRAYARALRDIAAIERRLARARSASAPARAKGHLTVKARTSQKEFLTAVARVQEHIAAGDIFQAVLSIRQELTPGIDAFRIYRALRSVNPSPYLYFLRLGKTEILGSSPEMLLKCSTGNLFYRPIAGTRPRGQDDSHDRRLEAELRADEKERAEHVMLVDLGRNDLGRVSEWGSVQVKDMMFVERYSHVMHLVSALEGKLRAGLTPLDAFAACFPAGTLTGAPKVRAMEIIETLEPVRRGIYGGAVFYADFAGNLDSCIAIRTMLVHGKKAYVQAGAGIVADSDPQQEHAEAMNKARALLRAVEKARANG